MLTSHGAHEISSCEEDQTGDNGMFCCDHVIHELWDIMVEHLRALRLHSPSGGTDSDMRNLARLRLPQTPRAVKCEPNDKRGQIVVTWSSVDSYQHKDLRVKVVLHADKSIIHTEEHVELARTMEAESIVLLENKNQTLPLPKSANIAVIGPMGNITNLGDYVVYRSQYNPTNVTPLQGIQNASTGTVTFAQGCERWSNDQSGFPAALAAAEAADVAVVVVGTWSRDQNELWQGLNATTGEHVDVASLNLVGAMGPSSKPSSKPANPLS